jgi:Flp pilus assembly pilin Flp
MLDLWKQIWRDEEGLTTVEYALLLILIVVVSATAWSTVGTSIRTKVNSVANII